MLYFQNFPKAKHMWPVIVVHATDKYTEKIKKEISKRTRENGKVQELV